ncbi:MAG: hypothetical protein PHI39_08395, partial [Kiritimatiellae bacterium]|nr:hypothetical protein [Kiritimatiellia bacterium]
MKQENRKHRKTGKNEWHEWEMEGRGQKSEGRRKQGTVEAGKQETQENRKERMARMGNGGQRAEVRRRQETG